MQGPESPCVAVTESGLRGAGWLSYNPPGKDPGLEIVQRVWPGISTLFAAWNTAVYVAQIEDERLAAVPDRVYREATQEVLRNSADCGSTMKLSWLHGAAAGARPTYFTATR